MDKREPLGQSQLGTDNGWGFSMRWAAFPATFGCKEFVSAPFDAHVLLFLWFMSFTSAKGTAAGFGKGSDEIFWFSQFMAFSSIAYHWPHKTEG